MLQLKQFQVSVLHRATSMIVCVSTNHQRKLTTAINSLRIHCKKFDWQEASNACMTMFSFRLDRSHCIATQLGAAFSDLDLALDNRSSTQNIASHTSGPLQVHVYLGARARSLVRTSTSTPSPAPPPRNMRGSRSTRYSPGCPDNNVSRPPPYPLSRTLRDH